ncbi:MAG: PIN domain-containing protein [Candidatus Bathyarchaeota archaeon]
MPTRILVDTNFLLIPVRFKVDIFTDSSDAVNDLTEFYVSSRVLNEIRLLKEKSKPSFVKELRLAETYAGQCTLIEDPSDGEVDDSLVNLASRERMVLGTTDSELRQKARKAGVKVIYLRQRNYLVLDG